MKKQTVYILVGVFLFIIIIGFFLYAKAKKKAKEEEEQRKAMEAALLAAQRSGTASPTGTTTQGTGLDLGALTTFISSGLSLADGFNLFKKKESTTTSTSGTTATASGAAVGGALGGLGV